MDNRAIAQILGEIADLLEIKDENGFKIRAYRSASETIAAYPDAVSRLDDRQLRDIPGIGKDLAARVRELAETGVSAYHRELLEQFPQTILDLLRLQGVGPKTVALLYSALNIIIQTFIQPLFVGDAVGLSTLITFLSLGVWTFLLGPLGALLAVPATLLVRALLIDIDPSAGWVNVLIGPTPKPEPDPEPVAEDTSAENTPVETSPASDPPG